MILKSLFNRRGREDLFVVGERRLERLKAEGRYSCYRATRAVLRKLSLFRKGKSLPVNEVTPAMLEDFRQFLALDQGNSNNTIVENLKVVLLLLEEGGASRDLRNEIKLSREQTPRTYLLESELERLMALDVKAESPAAVARDIFFVECRTGFRISDLLLLKWSSCRDNMIRLRMQKTQRWIEVPMSTQVRCVLEKYRTLFSQEEDYVFPLMAGPVDEANDFSISRKVVSATVTVNQQVKRLAARAGLEKCISTHVGRHTFATSLLSKGASIYEIKELLGHCDVKVTQIYAHLRTDRKRALIEMLE